MSATRVLMVCMGNICRSPTAEAVLRKKLKDAGLEREVEVDSAGTHGHYHAGEKPDARAMKHASSRGYDLGKIRARRVVEQDYTRFDWILAMDGDNLAQLRQQLPMGTTARLELLMSYATGFPGVRDIPDPYYGAPAGFERVLDLVEDACDGLVEALRRSKVEGTS